MNPQQIDSYNAELEFLSPLDVVRWALELAPGQSLVTTNFRPFEAVLLHMAIQTEASVPVLWVDHGANLPETYRFADICQKRLNLNLKPFLPRMTCAHWLALNGGQLPMPDQVELVEAFSRVMKLEPFERGMQELAPKVWLTALRREQNPQRAASLKLVMWDSGFNCLKINPLLNWTKAELQAYLKEHDLPDEPTYYDPAKGDEKHECGIHAALTTDRT